MPVYDVSAAAEALDVAPRQLDNIICRNEIPGVSRHRRGVSRRLSADAVVIIRLARDLVESTGLAITPALRLARRLAGMEGVPTVAIGGCATLSVDMGRLRATTHERLDSAVESVGRRRRGRPPTRVPPESTLDG